MGGHHHSGGGHRGGRGWGGGWGYPIIVEDYWDDPYFVGADQKLIAFHLGNPAAAAVPVPLSSTPDAALAVTATAPPPTLQTTVVATAPKPSKLPVGGALAGAVAGLAVAGPVGAAVGAAIGYFGGKAVSKEAPASTVAIAPTTPPAPKVSGDFGCDHTAGWAPHGDERMR